MKIKIGGISGIVLSAGLLLVAPAAFAAEYSGSLSSGLESGMSGTVNNCSVLSVSHGTVAAYPSCSITCDSGYTLNGNSCDAANCSPLTVSHGTVAAYPSCAITCDSGYTLSGSSCVARSGGSGGGGISGGGGGGVSSGASLTIGASGGNVNLAAVGSSPSVKFTAPAGAVSGATTVAIARVYTSSSTYVPPAGTTGLFMVGANVFQITATAGSTAITNFSQPVTLTFTYAEAQIPAGVPEAGLKVYYYDATAKTWVEVPSTINTATNTITASVNHLTQFAIFGKKTGAVATGDKLALIAQIQAQLNSLIAQLKAMVGDMIAQGKYVSPALMAFAPNGTAATATAAAKINQSWAFGQTGEEVKVIQTILAKDATIYPGGQITGYFGPATLAAVQKFQLKYGIADSGNSGFGIVGPATRAKLNEIAK